VGNNSLEIVSAVHVVGDSKPFALTEEDLGQLHAMGLSEAEFSAFTRFVAHRFDFILRRPSQPSWRMVRFRPLSARLLIAHLRGDLVLGVGCRWEPSLGRKGRHCTDILVVDLDLGGPWTGVEQQWFVGPRPDSAWPDLLRRYDALCGALGTPTLLFKSSASGGLHAYYLLSESVELHDLREPAGDAGTIVELLAARGIPEANGSVEVYPRGQYRIRRTQNRIRLPFGMGSVMLDPFTLDRLTLHGEATTGPNADLKKFTQSWQAGTLSIADPREWQEEALAVRSRKLPKRAQKQAVEVTKAAMQQGVSNAKQLWHEGLTGAGQLNAAVWTLARELRRAGTGSDEAVILISQWLDARHNGMSLTYNEAPTEAHREVRDVVGRVFNYPTGAMAWVPLPDLSMWEANRLLSLTQHDHQIAERATGEIHKRFVVQRLGFVLLQRAKQWVLTRVRECTQRAPAAYNDHTVGALSAMCVDRTTCEFVVPIPWKLRARVDGISKDAQWSLWKVLTEAGVFRPARVASANAHRAATYVVGLDFGVKQACNTALHSVESAILSTLPQDAIKTSYSKHFVARIRTMGPSGVVACVEPPEPELHAVRRFLQPPAAPDPIMAA